MSQERQGTPHTSTESLQVAFFVLTTYRSDQYYFMLKLAFASAQSMKTNCFSFQA